MTGIYKITNQLTQEVYIGQSRNIEHRIAYHKAASKRLNETTLLYRKIREYGIENFSFEVIEECDIDKLDEREIYWISYYNSYEKGYNMTRGGQGDNTASYVDVQKIYSLWDEGKTVGQIVEITKYSRSTVSNYLATYQNYTITESRRRSGCLGAMSTKNLEKRASSYKRICRYTFNGEYLDTWNSCKEILRELNINNQSVMKCCQKKFQSAGGFKWAFEGDSPITQKEWNEKRHRAQTGKLDWDKVHQIKALLAEKKMTQKEIGEMFGVSVYTISNIKRGISWKE